VKVAAMMSARSCSWHRTRSGSTSGLHTAARDPRMTTIASDQRPAPDHDVMHAVALLEIATDQHAKAARQLNNLDQRVVLGLLQILEPCDRPSRSSRKRSSTPAVSEPTIAGEPSPAAVVSR